MSILISPAMNERLNRQLHMELGAYYLYLSMSCQLELMGYKILAEFFAKQSDEERGHAMKFLRYVQETGGTVSLAALAAPKADFATPLEMAKAALESELNVTRSINDIATAAEKEKDHATRTFLNWFVDEQVEEVATMRDLIQLIELSGEKNILYVEHRVRHQMRKEE